MKIYICGKITGDPEYKDKFRRACGAVCAAMAGNPPSHVSIRTPAGMPDCLEREEYLEPSLHKIGTADLVCFTQDWEESNGAVTEYYYARHKRKQIAIVRWDETKSNYWLDFDNIEESACD